MNFLFKIKQQLLVTIFIFLTLILSFFLYLQFNKKKPIETIDYKAEADIVNPRFIKEKAIYDINFFLNTSTMLQDEKYSSILQGEFKQSLISSKEFLENNLNNVKHVDVFLKKMATLDKLRNQCLFEVLPEFKQLGG